jgi:hypothetical protein
MAAAFVIVTVLIADALVVVSAAVYLRRRGEKQRLTR